jgi:acyl-CoA thioester hydrolase
MTAATRTGPNVTEVRVSYADVDKMGVVYYGNYLRWFELGRAEYLRARGKPYKEIEEQGLLLPVVEAYARYREPARYDDLVEIQTALKDRGPVRVTFAYQVRRKSDGALLAEGHTVHCCTSSAGRPRRLPPELLALLAA